MSAPTDAFSPDRRRVILREFGDAIGRVNEYGDLIDDGDTSPDTRASFLSALDDAAAARREYKWSLPVHIVSRCPFTGLAVPYPIDDLGLDGLWWDFHAPVRHWRLRPGTCYGLTGAMRLGEQVEDTPHLVIAGPEVPYVIPRMLEFEGSKAVISSLAIGDHMAYLTAYFIATGDVEVPTTDEWGTGRWLGVDGDGNAIWTSRYREYQENDDADLREDRDTDLSPWIESGRVDWIAPGDETMELRSGIEGCPYLGLEGSLLDQWVVEEEVG